MSTTLAEEDFEESGQRSRFADVAPWIGMLALLSLVVGALSGVFWSRVVTLPSYEIVQDGSAHMTERGLTEVVSSDAWFVIVGAVVGLGLGIVTWKWFKPLGWPSALLAAGAGLLAGLVCWRFGELLGPGPFDERLAAANVDDLVPIALTLRSMSAPAVWAFAAVTPVLLAASLGPEDVPPPPRREVEAAAEDVATVDERGVLTEATDQEAPR